MTGDGLSGGDVEGLLRCYQHVRQFLVKPEPEAVVAEVDRHRRFWRPSQVRLLLLAESHVYTTLTEISRVLAPPGPVPDDLPRSFVRLVYCLGYGEETFLDQPIGSPRNAGTPQFWKLFFGCVKAIQTNADFAPILKGQSPEAQRLASKIGLLHKLRAAGVWLVDASIAALYGPGGVKPTYKNYIGALEASWDGHVGPLICDTAPEGILCIGKGVRSALEGRLSKLSVPWGVIPQPQARLTAQEGLEVFRTLRAVTESPREVAALAERWAK